MSSPAAVSDWDYTGCAGLAGLKGEERCIQHIFQIASVKNVNVIGKDWSSIQKSGKYIFNVTQFPFVGASQRAQW